jgi:hypothetical protein
MADVSAPKHVPQKPGNGKYYESPPRLSDSWRAERPGDLTDGQPTGTGFGSQGPDQGYALKLVKQFEDRVNLTEGERWADVSAGCVLVGLKRASLFGRAPVIHDLDIAFRVWGFLDDDPADALVTLRKGAFDRVENGAHHYLECRRITDAVDADVLRQTPSMIETAHGQDWSALIDTEVFAAAHVGHNDDLA